MKIAYCRWGSEFRGSGIVFRLIDHEIELRVENSRLMVQDWSYPGRYSMKADIWGLEFGVWGVGYGVQGLGRTLQPP